MLCKESSINYLKSFGYNVVRLPRTGISPLQIIVKKHNNFEHVGDISTVFKQGNTISLPQIEKDEPTASISGQRTSEIVAGIGLNILGNIIGAMGGSKLGLEAQYSDARTISFEYLDVLTDYVKIDQLDQYFSDAEINPHSKYLKELLESDDVYIITAVIKSNKLNVEGTAKNNIKVSIDVPIIKQIVGGNVKVESSSANNTQVKFEGSQQLVFGFKAIRLSYEDGIYESFEIITNDGGGLALNEQLEEEGRVLTTHAPFIDLNF